MLLEAAASSGVRPQQQPHANASRVLVLCSLVALSFVAGQHVGAASVIVPSSHRELQSVERRLQSVDTCTAPCILPSVANLAVLCGTGGGGAATTSPPPAATAATERGDACYNRRGNNYGRLEYVLECRRWRWRRRWWRGRRRWHPTAGDAADAEGDPQPSPLPTVTITPTPGGG